MKRIFIIQLKATLFVIVFSLNTVVSFACSVGLDMRFNATHDHDVESKAISHNNSHHHDKSLQHGETHYDHNTSKNHKDNCCNEKAIKFAQVDKSITQSVGFNAIFFTAFVSSFYAFDAVATSQVVTSLKYFVRSYHPPIPDIRIAIQSFQI